MVLFERRLNSAVTAKTWLGSDAGSRGAEARWVTEKRVDVLSTAVVGLVFVSFLFPIFFLPLLSGVGRVLYFFFTFLGWGKSNNNKFQRCDKNNDENQEMKPKGKRKQRKRAG